MLLPDTAKHAFLSHFSESFFHVLPRHPVIHYVLRQFSRSFHRMLYSRMEQRLPILSRVCVAPRNLSIIELEKLDYRVEMTRTAKPFSSDFDDRDIVFQCGIGNIEIRHDTPRGQQPGTGQRRIICTPRPYFGSACRLKVRVRRSVLRVINVTAKAGTAPQSTAPQVRTTPL